MPERRGLYRGFQRLCDLIGAGRGLHPAPDALQPGDGLLNRHAPQKGADALKVAAAAAQNLYRLDDAVLHLDFKQFGAYPSGGIGNLQRCSLPFLAGAWGPQTETEYSRKSEIWQAWGGGGASIPL